MDSQQGEASSEQPLAQDVAATSHETPSAIRPVWSHVHPVVRNLALGVIAWTVGAVWILFSHSYYGPLLFGVVTGVVITFVLLPTILFRIGRPSNEPQPPTFAEWSHGEFDTATGPIEARDAAILILIVPIAMAVGLTCLGLFDYFAAQGLLW